MQTEVKNQVPLDPSQLTRLVHNSRAGGPRELALLSALGLSGLVLFNLLVGLVVSGIEGSSEIAALIAIPLAMLICFPPLVLSVGLRGRQPDLLGLGALTASGPVSSGLLLGALSPLVVLYGLTGEVNAAFGLLVFMALGAAWVFGVRAVVQNARDLGEGGPGTFLALLHGGCLGGATIVLGPQFTAGV